MALSVTNTVNDIVSALESRDGALTTAERTQATNFWTDVITALYNRIKADLVVSSTVTSVTGVQTGGGTSGPGSATSSSIS